MGHLGVRKLIRSYNFYNDSNKKAKHKCDFCIPCILKVTTLDGICVNYDVLKCKDCLSFIKQKENVEGTVFNKLNDKTIIITATTRERNPIPAFKDLRDVKVWYK